jgi:hypothetical protein
MQANFGAFFRGIIGRSEMQMALSAPPKKKA